MYSPTIADLFCELYDAVDVQRLMPDIAEARGDTAVRRRKAAVSAAIIEATYDCERAREQVAADGSGWVALGHLLGIDAALEGANPFRAAKVPAALSDLVSHYGLHGRFSTDDTDGALLPRACPPGRIEGEPARFSDNFPGLTRASGPAWASAEHIAFPLASIISSDELADGLKIGCVPLVEESEEFEWSHYQRHDVRYYHLTADEQGIADRIEQVLDALQEAEIQLAVVPELTATPWLLEQWRAALRRRAGSASCLRWIFIGTGDLAASSKRAVNCGELLDASTGESLLSQRKMFGFTLSEKQLADWKLPLPTDHSLDEDIEKGTHCTVAEAGMGRMAIFICQDLSETTELDDVVLEHAISLLVTPVFSEPTNPHHWEHQSAKVFARNAGTTTVVANSMVVGRLQGQTGDIHASLIHTPWNTEAGLASEPAEVQSFTLLPGHSVSIP